MAPCDSIGQFKPAQNSSKVFEHVVEMKTINYVYYSHSFSESGDEDENVELQIREFSSLSLDSTRNTEKLEQLTTCKCNMSYWYLQNGASTPIGLPEYPPIKGKNFGCKWSGIICNIFDQYRKVHPSNIILDEPDSKRLAETTIKHGERAIINIMKQFGHTFRFILVASASTNTIKILSTNFEPFEYVDN
ncbi:hypothetical protein HHI36_003002 [Cryptolaemus montrouzieri]|uniref:PiggyBac transposable element-derived protein domain-containing protein n=1 Tax=Cryptolaemus montrouzieri TaxID=559131 RepID=A0ABD2PCS3_9CUCU